MITAFFIITTVIASIGWFSYWVGSAALAKYMLDKGYTPPSDEEMTMCSTYVLKKIFHVNYLFDKRKGAKKWQKKRK